MTMFRSISNRLRAARQSLGLTQAEVAEALNTHTAVIYAWEHGVRVIPTHQLYALTKFFPIDLHYIITGEKAPDAWSKHLPPEGAPTRKRRANPQVKGFIKPPKNAQAEPKE